MADKRLQHCLLMSYLSALLRSNRSNSRSWRTFPSYTAYVAKSYRELCVLRFPLLYAISRKNGVLAATFTFNTALTSVKLLTAIYRASFLLRRYSPARSYPAIRAHLANVLSHPNGVHSRTTSVASLALAIKTRAVLVHSRSRFASRRTGAALCVHTRLFSRLHNVKIATLSGIFRNFYATYYACPPSYPAAHSGITRPPRHLGRASCGGASLSLASTMLAHLSSVSPTCKSTS